MLYHPLYHAIEHHQTGIVQDQVEDKYVGGILSTRSICGTNIMSAMNLISHNHCHILDELWQISQLFTKLHMEPIQITLAASDIKTNLFG